MSELTQDQRNLRALVEQVSRKRAQLYQAMRVHPDDSDEVKQAKAEFLLRRLEHYRTDKLSFIDDFGWAPDPMDNFGSSAVPVELVDAGLLPSGMVPLIPFPAQKRFVQVIEGCLRDPGQHDVAMEKSRQVALSTFATWLILGVFLFDDVSPCALGTYEEDLIDKGGKGHRTADTLFGRLRMFLDALVTCCPHLAFGKVTEDNLSGIPASYDVDKKLTRPIWRVHGHRIAKGAEKNYIKGMLPGDSFARGLTLKVAFLDELGQYSERKKRSDWDAWSACRAATKVRVGGGTLPKTGGTSSLLYTLMHDPDDSLTHRVPVHWSDIPAYMYGARWRCRGCGFENDHPQSPGPGGEGTERECASCRRVQRCFYGDVTSDWYERARAGYKGDLVGIARELDMDWGAAQGETLFDVRGDMLCPVSALHGSDGRLDRARFLMFDGFDPGTSIKNPGAFVSVALDRHTLEPFVVSHWMSDAQWGNYWVPFFKRWGRAQVARSRVLYGLDAGKTFQEAYEYPESALVMLDWLSQFPLGVRTGDAYGHQRHGSESQYEVMSRHGVDIFAERTLDREALVRAGVEWGSKVRVVEEIARVKPPKALGGFYPSSYEVFTQSKPRDPSGQSEYKFDVDKEDPPHHAHPCDAWFYAVKGFNAEPHVVATLSGEFISEGYDSGPGYIDWGDPL